MKTCRHLSKLCSFIFLAVVIQLLAFAIITPTLAEAAVSGRTLFVDNSFPRSGNGLSEATPFKSLSEGIKAARDGDTIRIARGIYNEQITINTPNLLITARDFSPTSEPNVEITAKTSKFTVRDSHNTTWRGITFSSAAKGADVVILDKFSGRFEYCTFKPAGDATEQILVNARNSFATFHGSSFLNLTSESPAITFASDSPSQLTATYCLFQDLSNAAAELNGQAGAIFTNCLFARNGYVLSRSISSTGEAKFINSIFYLNLSTDLFQDFTEGMEPVRVYNSILTPAISRWGTTFYADLDMSGVGVQENVIAENCRTASPRFVSARGRTTLNLGIDDAQNVEFWSKIMEEASLYGIDVTIGINTTAMRDEYWKTVNHWYNLGSEIASHTSSHLPATIEDTVEVSYYRSDIEDPVALTITNDKHLFVKSGEKILLDYNLVDENNHLKPSMGDLVEKLTRLGATAKLVNSAYRDIPARYLISQENLDIFFPNFTIPLPVNNRDVMYFEISNSVNLIEQHVPGLKVNAFVYPFTVATPTTMEILKELKFKVGRGGTLAELSPYDEGFNRWEVWAFSATKFLNNPTPSDAQMKEITYMMLDFFNDRNVYGAVYSHGEREMSLDAWKVFLSVLAEEETNIVPLTKIVDIAKERATAAGLSTTGDVWNLPQARDLTDYHLKPSSSLRGAGMNTQIPYDFEGKPVPVGTRPNIGLYQ